MKKSILIISLFVFISIFTFTACMSTSIRELNITRIEISLHENNNYSLAPGKVSKMIVPEYVYRLTAVVYTADGEIITEPDYDDFEITSPNNTFSKIENRWDEIYVTATPDSISFADGRKFQLSIGVFDNPAEETVYEWDLDWYSYGKIFDFTGNDGVGYNNSNTLIYFGDKDEVHDGENGDNGEDGITCHFDIAYYETVNENNEIKKRIVLYDKVSYKLYLISDLHIIYIDVSGGNGENGGDGSDPGAETRAGNGGNGGNGGSGGNVIINYKAGSDVLDHISIIAKGGNAGFGGSGGSGFNKYGSDGINGHSGSDGDYFKHVVNNINELFTDVNHPLFDRDKLKE